MFLPCTIFSTVEKSTVLWLVKKGQSKRYWLVLSTPVLHKHKSEGVSAKLCRFLCWRSRLRPTRSWKMYLRRGGLKTENVSFGGGRMREIICFLRISKDGRFWKEVMMLFQWVTALGKKLFLYLSVRHRISWNILGRSISTFLLGAANDVDSPEFFH